MVMKKATVDGKPKNVTNKSTRGKSSESSLPLVDKNGNMLPAETKGKRDEKCQVKRQGIKTINTIDSKGSNTQEITTHIAEDGTVYELDDCVYIDSQRPDVPFFICAIKEFKMAPKRECVYVGVKWFYRPSEVPESVYQLLVQDRNTENGSQDHILEDPSVKERELFVSDAVDSYAVSALRGKCRVKCLSDVSSLKEFISQNDHFFFVLRYNPETRRLANHKGEIRVGPSHQVPLPECQPKPLAVDELAREPPKEELTWKPTLEDYDLMMFIGAARSMAQYAGICKEGDTNKGLTAAARDATTINALKVLHKSKYDTARALQSLVKRPFPKTSRMDWSEDDNKKFVKGLRQFGKNFYKIRKELLPEKETGDLVEYYYIWKKTPSAMSSRPHRRRRHNVLRRRNCTRSTKTSSSEFVELSSCSEDDYDSEDSDKDFSLYCCRHCYSSKSRSWHHGGYERSILCSTCLEYFKKYGVMRKLEGPRNPPEHMFKGRGKENEVDYFINGKQLRSRRSTPNTSSSLRYGRTKTCSPVDTTTRESPISGRKLTRLSKPGSPSGASTGSNTSSSGSNKKTQASKRRRPKRNTDSILENTLPQKRKKSVSRESDEELETDQSERNSSPMVEQVATPLGGDVTSISSRTSTNEETCLSPSPESIDDAERVIDSGKFAARNVPDGKSCARTGLPFTCKKLEKTAVTGDRSLKEKKIENEGSSSCTARSQKSEMKSSSEIITSSNMSLHQEEQRKYLAGGMRYPYPGIPGAHAASIMTHMPVQLHGDTSVLPWLRPGPGAMKDFETWYSPHKAASLNRGNSGMPPAILHPSSLLDRSSPLHKDGGILFPGGHIPGVPPPVGTDPITGLHHSHSHFHTHYHVHPDHQPRSPSVALEPNLLWRNPQHEMWLHPNAGIPAGHPHAGLPPTHPRHLVNHTDDIPSVPPPYFHGLCPPPPREFQFQHELMMSQGLKMEYNLSLYPQLLAREQLMRFARPQGSRIENELRRLETGEEPNLLHRTDPRVMRSPALRNLENGIFHSSNPILETIDLSKDD
ncbi:arginine-glutamic acid dipeptide repeats protein-like [Dendronephthya gigantea]|uniref:arginine-glutamic acid dipeptide repeats protein-like n=1 Tax=Dendronephthya gigantea TaxID=151771 RepID=UPI00106B182E|nr:arginine-glutamic acid dipeptide repeats protein-like [Dendronephthya gigantea]XP_028393687.1 arginine-glutamic acid dipeptide repeats protein-like [Dendronephthya gigantea]XP_028393688.1 arginine-glutamic acid dipeptide repeats protein-like [Dendronephthya gigantea]XP_028393690.1 arginine-glutamic acid dipeptide repeats protein-like [Dendronephthya gigantea]XP_028393691.1 arginine-glutamic acid dipeptide repeats protein-like [Dendronephthya gigantea]